MDDQQFDIQPIDMTQFDIKPIDMSQFDVHPIPVTEQPGFWSRTYDTGKNMVSGLGQMADQIANPGKTLISGFQAGNQLAGDIGNYAKNPQTILDAVQFMNAPFSKQAMLAGLRNPITKFGLGNLGMNASDLGSDLQNNNYKALAGDVALPAAAGLLLHKLGGIESGPPMPEVLPPEPGYGLRGLLKGDVADFNPQQQRALPPGPQSAGALPAIGETFKRFQEPTPEPQAPPLNPFQRLLQAPQQPAGLLPAVGETGRGLAGVDPRFYQGGAGTADTEVQYPQVMQMPRTWPPQLPSIATPDAIARTQTGRIPGVQQPGIITPDIGAELAADARKWRNIDTPGAHRQNTPRVRSSFNINPLRSNILPNVDEFGRQVAPDTPPDWQITHEPAMPTNTVNPGTAAEMPRAVVGPRSLTPQEILPDQITHPSTVSPPDRTYQPASVEMPRAMPSNAPSDVLPQYSSEAPFLVDKATYDKAGIGDAIKTTDGQVITKGTKQPKQNIWQRLYNLPKSAMATDMPYTTSALYRQAAPLAGTSDWLKAFSTAAKSFGDAEAYKTMQDQIEQHPLVKPDANGVSFLRDRMGVKIADPMDLKQSEDMVRSDLAEKIPGYGSYIKASNRAYAGALNDLRLKTADKLIKASQAQAAVNPFGNLDPMKNAVYAKQLGDLVNDLTGAPALKTDIWFGKNGTAPQINLERYRGILNNTLFSPNMIARNIKALNPFEYMNAPPLIRQQRLLALGRQVGAWATIAGLAKMAGAQVSTDPTNSDFGKIKSGNVRLDPGQGLQQYLVLAAQQMAGGATSSQADMFGKNNFKPFGQGYRADTRLDKLESFMGNRLHPSLRYFLDLTLAHSDDKPFHIGDRTLQLFAPMVLGDLKNLSYTNPDIATMLGLPLSGLMGANIQDYGSKFSDPTFLPSKYDVTLGGKK